jgi:RES domain-containing protein
MPPFTAAVQGLALGPESRTWFRALQTHFLSSNHTTTVCSRYSGATPATPGYEVLYLAENPMVALLEVQALFGSPTTPGGVVPHPHSTWTILNVAVRLSGVADVTDMTNQTLLDVTAQELTGDWLGYRLRGPQTTVKQPTGLAPTQDLGAALHGVQRLEGFRTLSARAPYHEILVVFPQKLQPGSLVSWFNPLTGTTETIP